MVWSLHHLGENLAIEDVAIGIDLTARDLHDAADRRALGALQELRFAPGEQLQQFGAIESASGQEVWLRA